VVLQFRQEGVVVDAYLAHAKALPDVARKAVEASKQPFATHVREMVDLIAYHELGHIYVDEFGIEPHTSWFSELLATYFAYAFIAERRPDLAKTWEIVSLSDSQTTPRHRSLADFERLYLEVGAGNYAWYQGRFSERVFAMPGTDRLEFLRKVKDAFPSQATEKLALEEVLERVETISAWLQGLGAIVRRPLMLADCRHERHRGRCDTVLASHWIPPCDSEPCSSLQPWAC
jgi:hypothetical protein